MRNNFKSLPVFILLSLTGCMGVYEEGFDCPPGVGVGCKSISQVNTMVNRGLLPKSESDVAQEQLSESATSSNSCKTCVASSNTPIPYPKPDPSKFSIWWTPQWDKKSSSEPISLSPTKG